jgi:tetraprenyl-beta-curcumene synthase
VSRRRTLAARIPDPALRRLALQALEQKRGNLEGAAAFAALVPRASRSHVVDALVGCQTICDYLDLLSEQPSRDPVRNGNHLHKALIVATTPGESHCDYYLHHGHSDDGGYLRALVESVRGSLMALPRLSLISEPMRRATGRIVAYQSFNHGDKSGSYESFQRWASAETCSTTGLRWWETGAGAGSTMTLFVLIAAAADPSLRQCDIAAIENAYFPWIGALHSLLDSLVDHDEDIATGERGLIDCYPSPLDAANRMSTIADEALDRATALPCGRRHALILAAMTGFYLCELHSSVSPHAQLIAPSVLDAIGELATPAMAILGARRSLRAAAPGAGGTWLRSLPVPRSLLPERLRFLPEAPAPAQTHLESQVPDFPLFFSPDSRHDSRATRTDAHSVQCPFGPVPSGGAGGPPTNAQCSRLWAGPSFGISPAARPLMRSLSHASQVHLASLGSVSCALLGAALWRCVVVLALLAPFSYAESFHPHNRTSADRALGIW